MLAGHLHGEWNLHWHNSVITIGFKPYAQWRIFLGPTELGYNPLAG